MHETIKVVKIGNLHYQITGVDKLMLDSRKLKFNANRNTETANKDSSEFYNTITDKHSTYYFICNTN